MIRSFYVVVPRARARDRMDRRPKSNDGKPSTFLFDGQHKTTCQQPPTVPSHSPLTILIIIMPRGKNYVNNNQGVVLQASTKGNATSMRLCEYGAGCIREDCIYRHDGDGGKTEEVCLPFLAGKCTFADDGCRRRHPIKQECERLMAKYKRTRCRFADDCRTDGCLYLHPKEMKPSEPNYVEPHNLAFPPLNGAEAPAPPKAIVNSAWRAAPMVQSVVSPPAKVAFPPVQVASPPAVQAAAPAWFPHQQQPNYSAPYYNPSVDMYPPAMDMSYGGMPPQYYAPYGHPHVVGVPQGNFNANAKEFVPGNL
jgi:hypothetical protein